MVDRPNKPSALASAPGLPQAQVNITHDNSRVNAVLPTGESVEILLFGATVISWKGQDGDERLWLSDIAALDGSAAVRGGIPLVFPVFATQPDHASTTKLPHHGLARTSKWEFLGKSTSESTGKSNNSIKLDFGLSSTTLSEEVQKLWPYAFSLIYSVTLSPDALVTSMVVTNDGDQPFEYQLLLHTYLRVKDISKVHVDGLDEAKYIDKVDGAKEKKQSGLVTFTGETDRIYTPAKGPSAPVEVYQDGKKLYSVVRDNLDNVVVWNPWAEKAAGMGDFAPKDGYKNMICIEAGAVGGWQKVEPGDTFEGACTVTV